MTLFFFFFKYLSAKWALKILRERQTGLASIYRFLRNFPWQSLVKMWEVTEMPWSTILNCIASVSHNLPERLISASFSWCTCLARKENIRQIYWNGNKQAWHNTRFRIVLGELFSQVEGWHRSIQYENDFQPRIIRL